MLSLRCCRGGRRRRQRRPVVAAGAVISGVNLKHETRTAEITPQFRRCVTVFVMAVEFPPCNSKGNGISVVNVTRLLIYL